MKLKASSLLATLLLVSGTAFAADKPVAKVNGAPIPANLSSALIEEQASQGAPVNDELKKAVREELVRREVLTQEAKKKGFDRKPEIMARMELARQAVLVGFYVDEWVKTHPIPEDKLKAEYDRRVAEIKGEEYKARHILVEKEDDAKAIIAKLQAGEKFADLATKNTIDVGSKESGGDLGWSIPQNYVQPFAEAITKLEKGKFTAQPVKTQFGYHVILLEDTRKIEPPKFELIKGKLAQGMQQDAVAKMIAELVSKAKVE